MAHMLSEDGDDPLSLLMFAGLIKDDLPWLSEVLSEAYREIRDSDPTNVSQVVERLRRVVKTIGRRDLMMDFGGTSKEAHHLMMEMPRMLDHFLHRFEKHRFEKRRSKLLGDAETEAVTAEE
jgi:hypothetical protein